MCGIAISLTPWMVNGISHRGTEVRQLEYGRLWLGHARLPIQTLPGSEDSGVQPIRLRDGYLLYNGEIYNYPSKYSSDTEYLQDLFNSCKTQDVLHEAQKWDGMWAIVKVTYGGLWAFTDPLGKKQLYYNSKGEVCSEMLPLAHGEVEFDPYWRSEAFKWGYNTDDRTPYKGVRRLMPNRVLTVIAGGTKVTARNWYPWKVHPYLGSLGDAAGELRELVTESVKRRMLSKGHRLGVLLSGGLDSSIIASILHDSGADMELYSVDNDEGRYARLMAQKLGCQDRVTWIPSDFSDAPYQDPEVFAALRYNETPIDLGSLMPQHRMCSAVKQDIIVTGDGADELFGGYRRIHDYDSQLSDVFQELPFYHLPRLDRASMRFTKELRTPFLGHDVVRFALSLPYEYRIDKKVLKEAFRGTVPDEIIDRAKTPLKSKGLQDDPLQWRKRLHHLFYDELFQNKIICHTQPTNSATSA